MKFSIITVTYNAEKFLPGCIESVLGQKDVDLEYIIVDGASNDGTVEIIKNKEKHINKWISEPDEGLYDAMNKGIKMASGNVIGILNADDVYAHSRVLSNVKKKLLETNADSVYGDLVYVDDHDLSRVTRYYRAKGFEPQDFRSGNMPPHPTFFVKREVYAEHGLFDTNYEICADFDLMLRFLLKKGVSYSYLPETLVKMRSGGASTRGINSTLTINREMLQACKKYQIPSNYFLIYSKYLKKVWQLVQRPS